MMRLTLSAEEIGEQFGRFQDLECQGTKEALVTMENEGSGRVSLSLNFMDTHLMEVGNSLTAASISITWDPLMKLTRGVLLLLFQTMVL